MEEDLFANAELVDDEIDIDKIYEEDDEHKIRETEFEETERHEHDEDKSIEGEILEDEYKDAETYISQAPEWRVFLENSKSWEAVRTGQALTSNRLLSTMIENKKLQKIQELVDKTSRTDEESFNIALTTCAVLLN